MRSTYVVFLIAVIILCVVSCFLIKNINSLDAQTSTQIGTSTTYQQSATSALSKVAVINTTTTKSTYGASAFDVRRLDEAVSEMEIKSFRSLPGAGSSAVYTFSVGGVKLGSDVSIRLNDPQPQLDKLLASLSCRRLPYKTIFWIVPWGRADSQPPYCSTPGVVVVIPCTPGASVDQTQFKTSLDLIRQYKGRELFVNLFCAASDWRGNLKRVDLSSATGYLEKLKENLGNGSGIFIGFSEMKACVEDTACRSQLVDAYKKLKSMFPEAQLFYYGTSSELLKDILNLAEQAKLDLVGMDIYEYEYSNGRLQVYGWFLDNLKGLKGSGYAVMVGEVGFRICDAQGYVEPWNWTKPVRQYNCSATIAFYNQTLSQLASVKPKYIGIWAWNDPTYGVALSPEVTAYFNRLLVKYPALADLYKKLARAGIYLVKRDGPRESVLLTAASIAGYAGSLVSLNQITSRAPSNVSVVKVVSPAGTEFHLIAVNLTGVYLLYDPGGYYVRYYNYSIITSLSEDLYLVDSLPPRSEVVWIKWNPTPALEKLVQFLDGYEAYVYGVGINGALQVLVRTAAGYYNITPTPTESRRDIVVKYVYRFNMPPEPANISLILDNRIVANITHAKARPYALEPEVYVYVHNSTVCARFPFYVEGLNVSLSGTPATRRGAVWCGRAAEFPVLLMYTVGNFSRGFWIDPPQVRFYHPSIGLAPLMAVSSVGCGVQLKSLKASQIDPYPLTTTLYADGIIYAYVKPGDEKRVVEAVLGELCRPVYYVYRAEVTTSAEIAARSVVFVIDTSGSMGQEGKLEAAKRAVFQILEYLSSSRVSVGVIAFSDKPVVVSDMTTNYQAVMQRVQALRAGGSTDIGDSLIEAYKMLRGSGVVVLLTDGRHNTGTPPREALAKVKVTSPVYVIGLGSDVDEQELRWIAQATGGIYLFSPTPGELLQAFSSLTWRWETLVYNGSGMAEISGIFGTYIIRIVGDPRQVLITFRGGKAGGLSLASDCAVVAVTDLERCGLGKYDPQTNTAYLNTYGADFLISVSATRYEGSQSYVTVSSPNPSNSFIVGDDYVCVGSRYYFSVVNPKGDPRVYVDGREVAVRKEGDIWAVDTPPGENMRIVADIVDSVTGRLLKRDEKVVRILKDCLSLRVDPPSLQGTAPAQFAVRVAVTGKMPVQNLELRATTMIPSVRLDVLSIRASVNQTVQFTGKVEGATSGLLGIVALKDGQRIADAVIKLEYSSPGKLEPRTSQLTVVQHVGAHSASVELKTTGTPQIGIVNAPNWIRATIAKDAVAIQTNVASAGIYKGTLFLTDSLSIYPITVTVFAVDKFVDLNTVRWILGSGLLKLDYLAVETRGDGYAMAGLVTERISAVIPPYVYALYTDMAIRMMSQPGWKIVYYVNGQWTYRQPKIYSFQTGTQLVGVAPDIRGDVNFDGKVDLADVYMIWKRTLGEKLPVADDVLDINDDGKVDINDVITDLRSITK